MNIGFIYTKFYPVTSSASVHGYQLVKGFKNLGHNVYTIGVGKNEFSVDYPKSIFGVINFLRKVDALYIRINPWLINDWFSLAKIISLGRIKIIWEINAPVEEVLSTYSKNIPQSVHKWLKTQNIKRKFLAKFCDASICVSNVLNEYSKNQLKVKNSHYVPNGSDPNLFKTTDKDPNNPLFEILKNKFVIVWAGNAETKWQGLDLIYETANYFNEHDKDVYFLIISNVSVYNTIVLPNILSISEINYEKLHQFLNYGDLALCVYKDYDWCKYGFYGSSLKLFDYMSMGLPIIASNVAQINEILLNSKAGKLIYYNKQELIDSIAFYKKNPDVGIQLGNSARELLIKKYTWGHTIKNIDQIIKALI